MPAKMSTKKGPSRDEQRSARRLAAEQGISYQAALQELRTRSSGTAITESQVRVALLVAEVAADPGAHPFGATWVAARTSLDPSSVQHELDALVRAGALALTYELISPLEGQSLGTFGPEDALPIGEAMEDEGYEPFVVEEKDLVRRYLSTGATVEPDAFVAHRLATEGTSEDEAAAQEPGPTPIVVSEEQLEAFLCGVEVEGLRYSDADGSGEVVWADEAAEEFEPDEIDRLRAEGMEFWVSHPVTGHQVTVRVKVGRAPVQ